MVLDTKPRRQRLPHPAPAPYHENGASNGHHDPILAPPSVPVPGPSWGEFLAIQTSLLLAVALLFGTIALAFVGRAGERATGVSATPAATVEAIATPVSTPVPTPAAVTAARLAAPQVAPAIGARAPQLVKVELEAREVAGLLSDGIGYDYWTFNGTVPGPMIRARQGDTVEITLRNAPDNKVAHSIDLRAVTGPGGGGEVTMVAPGESKTFRFLALHAGVFVYQSASDPVAQQIASGMYGLIVVEPPQGLPHVDREFYVMQGELYLEGNRDEHGQRTYSAEKALAGQPDYVVFNGAIDAVNGANALKARTGETVRIFFGVAGPNNGGSLHVTGQVFDRVAVEGVPLDDPARWATNVESLSVPVGTAAIAELRSTVPGRYTLTATSVSQAQRGATGVLIIEGAEDPTTFTPQH